MTTHAEPTRLACMPHTINRSFTDTSTVVGTHGLSKRFGGGVLAVDDVDMTVRRGEVDQALLVLALYFLGLIVVAAGLLRLRDVS
jgi:hypothetical protein